MNDSDPLNIKKQIRGALSLPQLTGKLWCREREPRWRPANSLIWGDASRKNKAALIHKRDLWGVSFKHSALVHACEETTWGLRKNDLRGVERRVSSTHTGPGIMPTPTNQTGQLHNSWSTGKSTQKVENNFFKLNGSGPAKTNLKSKIQKDRTVSK